MCSRTTTLNPPLIDISSAVDFNIPRNMLIPRPQTKVYVQDQYSEDMVISKLNHYINELNNIHLPLITDRNFDYRMYQNNLLTINEIKSQVANIQNSLSGTYNRLDHIMRGINDITNRIRDFQKIIQYNADNS